MNMDITRREERRKRRGLVGVFLGQRKGWEGREEVGGVCMLKGDETDGEMEEERRDGGPIHATCK